MIRIWDILDFNQHRIRNFQTQVSQLNFINFQDDIELTLIRTYNTNDNYQ